MQRRDVVRAQWQLWALTFAIVAALTGALIVLATGDQTPAIGVIPSRAILVITLSALVGAFTLYAIDRERGLMRLNEQLHAEQLESERLAARVSSLAELTREQDTSAALLEGSADGIVVVDASLAVLRFNASMQRLVEVSRAEAMGRDVTEILHLHDAAGAPLEDRNHPVRAVFTDGVPRSCAELKLVRADGSHRWVSATISPIFDGEVPALVLIALRDIAEQKEQQAMQRDFVSMAAHELRSPLTAIKGFTRTLMARFDELPAEKRARYLSLVNEQSDRLARLVDDLMQVSRIDSHRVSLDRAPLDLADTVRALIEQFRGKWAGRTIELHTDGTMRPANVDAHKIEEVLINLIDNAVKYSPAGAPVGVSVRSAGDEVEVAVRDHGVGIPAHEVAALFKKFSRLAQTSGEVSGTGLGLYIVRGLVEAHGGRVWVSSTPGEGSVFSFSVPALAATAQEQEEDARESEAASA